MAIRLTCILLVVLAVVVGFLLAADKPPLRKQTLWIVPHEHEGEIKAQIGDVVQIESDTLPVIPMHLGKSFKAKLDGRALQRIGSLPPEGEGAFHASFYFKAVAATRSTVTVMLLDAEGKQLQTWDYAVVVQDRAE